MATVTLNCVGTVAAASPLTVTQCGQRCLASTRRRRRQPDPTIAAARRRLHGASSRSAETLAESIADAYRAHDGAGGGVDIAEADQYADRCLAAIDVALGTNRFEAATIEWATTELDGVVVTIAVVVGTDGSIAVLRTPVDDCVPVELVSVVDPG